ncbi:unnamed protein product [Spirodela intermedia]|uniref:Uncharacterized protein n=2 Tax=Spirodela intermedia TaxID=51605 RepID=A0A7I8K4H8_SPIIN|nr:unnamed protein product [Spirodela intermedia]CAA6656047.1 unnamed protein product [Spirodela intermedia]CAA7391479.1 unnamed protein product [Spirodela intermedia]
MIPQRNPMGDPVGRRRWTSCQLGSVGFSLRNPCDDSFSLRWSSSSICPCCVVPSRHPFQLHDIVTHAQQPAHLSLPHCLLLRR